jgi:hypothetical protein
MTVKVILGFLVGLDEVNVIEASLVAAFAPTRRR